MNENEQNSIEENEVEDNTIDENNTTAEMVEDNTTENTIVFENKIDEIAYNTSVIKNTGLFFVSIVVVVFVCFLLWKVLDNFISF